MAGRLIGWRPWPPQSAKRFQARLIIGRVENAKSGDKLRVELKWKGQKAVLRPLRKGVKRNCTREEELRGEEGLVEFNEEFVSNVTLVPNRDRNGFNPWEVSFALFNGPKSKSSILGMASLNLAEYPAAFGGQTHLILSLLLPNSTIEFPPVLHISLGLLELGPTQQPSPGRPQKPPPSTTASPISPPSGEYSSQTENDENTLDISNNSSQSAPDTSSNSSQTVKDENTPETSNNSVLKAGLRKMKALKQLVPSGKSKKHINDESSSSDPGRASPIQTVSDTEAVLAAPLPPLSPSPSVLKAGLRKVKILKALISKSKKTREFSGDTDSLSTHTNDSDLLEEYGSDPTVRKSFSYGPLTSANFWGNNKGCYEDWVYYSENRSAFYGGAEVASTSPAKEEKVVLSSKRSLLPWRKRKLSYCKAKGEPLLKKAYAEEGGDDIDYDRRVLTSSDESVWGLRNMDGSGTGTPSDDPFDDLFGDGRFTIGNWETKQILSRDNQLKLSTDVFFASMDQRHERAAGESACAVLVATIADWFQLNPNTMPIRSQIDTLIREGSLVWRNLCVDETYMKRFPDGHFDLDTVLDAKVRQLAVVGDKSFIGFFHPDGEVEEDASGFEFLHGSMSFDGIWDEIEKASLGLCEGDLNDPMVYIISWNDHFFVLKVEKDAYYIVDTLGERLYEGCDRAYILKFDESTVIYRVPKKPTEEKGEQEITNEMSENEIVCKGKETCREYIKRFLAAIPIRELQEDIKKGRIGSGSAQLHQRLQIEFHFTKQNVQKVEEPFPEVSWPVFDMSEMTVRGFSEISATPPAVSVA